MVLSKAKANAWRSQVDRLHEEVAYLSMYLHWPYEQVMRLGHQERRRWVTQVAVSSRVLPSTTRR